MLNKIDVASSSPIRRSEARNPDSLANAAKPESSAPKTSREGLLPLNERALDVAKASPDVNMSRVEQIKQAISRGEFTLDAKAVARAFIAMENEQT